MIVANTIELVKLADRSSLTRHFADPAAARVNPRPMLVKRSVSLGLSRRERERYSLARAILASASGRLATEAAFELEVSRAEAKARRLDG
jgi:hypothetical protein